MHFRDERKRWRRASEATQSMVSANGNEAEGVEHARDSLRSTEERQAIQEATKKPRVGALAVQKEIGSQNLLAIFVPEQDTPENSEALASTPQPEKSPAVPHTPRRIEFVESEPFLGESNGASKEYTPANEPQQLFFDDIASNCSETDATPFDPSKITLKTEPKRRS